MKSYLKVLCFGFLTLGFVSCKSIALILPLDLFNAHSYKDAKYLYIDIGYKEASKMYHVTDTLYCLTDKYESNDQHAKFPKRYTIFYSSNDIMLKGVIPTIITTQVYESKKKKKLIYESKWIAVDFKDLRGLKGDGPYIDLRFKIPFEEKPVYVEIFEESDGKKRYIEKNTYTEKRALTPSSLSESLDGCARKTI